MHLLTPIIALSAAVLALPRPLPAPQALTDTLLDGLNSILGTPDHHNSKCHRRNKDDLATCIHQCVDDFCVVGDAGCSSCISGCTSRRVCDDGDSRANDRPARHGTTRTQEPETSE
ncbi:hypothetical protein F5Y13DRAFT_198880 [Hypoxylon sp. FL1857]|nr:hypothetical protein F5Y13DRAFT_198880 [Hypoxylon sp. FL1857]